MAAPFGRDGGTLPVKIGEAAVAADEVRADASRNQV